MDPINYTAAMPQPDFTRDIAQGLQVGQLYQQRDMQNEQRQMALDAAKQYQADVAAAMANPTPHAFAGLAVKYPQQREAVQQAWGQLSDADQRAEGDTMAQAYSAYLAGQPDLAKQVVQNQIEARKNAGLDTTHYDNFLSLMNSDPKQAQGAIGFTLAHIMDPKNYAQQFTATQGEQRTEEAAPATLAEKQAEAVQKQQATLGQVIGGLASVDGIKPSQVQTAFRALAAKGVINKDDLSSYLSEMPTDPKLLKPYLQGFVQTALTPEQQMKYTTPSADAKLQSDTSIKTTGMNNATSLAVAKENASASDADPTLPPDTLKMMAQQYLAGDKTVMQNLGRGAQGAANIVALRKAITDEATTQGMTGPQIAAKMAEFAGTMAGQRTAGTRIANIEMASNEAESLIPLARDASSAVARSGLLPFGKAQIMFNEQTNNPAMRKFAAANNALVNVYSRAISPSGVPTVSDKEHARHLLSTAMDQQSYLAVLDQMERELSAARHAPQAVRSAFSANVTGTPMSTAFSPAPPQGLPSGWSVEVH